MTDAPKQLHTSDTELRSLVAELINTSHGVRLSRAAASAISALRAERDALALEVEAYREMADAHAAALRADPDYETPLKRQMRLREAEKDAYCRGVHDAAAWIDQVPDVLANRQEISRAIRALADVQPVPRVRIKPLVWVQSGGSHVMDGESHAVPSGYTVRYADENGWKWTCLGMGAYGWEPSPSLAQAAAQADYEDRIRSALIGGAE